MGAVGCLHSTRILSFPNILAVLMSTSASLSLVAKVLEAMVQSHEYEDGQDEPGVVICRG